MTDLSMALIEHLRNLAQEGGTDFLNESIRVLTQMLIEMEASEQIGAGRYERTPERKTQRNGYRERGWETRVGEVNLRIPKLRSGSFFPSLLEPRRRAEQALLRAVRSAYLPGVHYRCAPSLLSPIEKQQISSWTWW